MTPLLKMYRSVLILLGISKILHKSSNCVLVSISFSSIFIQSSDPNWPEAIILTHKISFYHLYTYLWDQSILPWSPYTYYLVTLFLWTFVLPWCGGARQIYFFHPVKLSKHWILFPSGQTSSQMGQRQWFSCFSEFPPHWQRFSTVAVTRNILAKARWETCRTFLAPNMHMIGLWGAIKKEDDEQPRG